MCKTRVGSTHPWSWPNTPVSLLASRAMVASLASAAAWYLGGVGARGGGGRASSSAPCSSAADRVTARSPRSAAVAVLAAAAAVVAAAFGVLALPRLGRCGPRRRRRRRRARGLGRRVDRLVDRRRPLVGGARERARLPRLPRPRPRAGGVAPRGGGPRRGCVVLALRARGCARVGAARARGTGPLPGRRPHRPAARARRLLERPRAARRGGGAPRPVARHGVARRTASAAGGLLVYGAVLALLLTQSRAGLLALVVGVALWLCSPERSSRRWPARAGARPRPALVVAAWAFTRPALVEDGALRADRVRRRCALRAARRRRRRASRSALVLLAPGRAARRPRPAPGCRHARSGRRSQCSRAVCVALVVAVGNPCLVGG